MNILNPSVKTLFNTTFDQLCHSMNGEILQYVLKWLPPSICLQIIWKILGIHCDSHMLPVELGCYMSEILFNHIEHGSTHNLEINPEILEQYATKQQIKFVDHFNFSSLYDHQLFFKLVEVTDFRDQLLTLFQICIQIKGLNFPLNFAQEWVKIETPDINKGMCFPDIEKGLKLGIFLGDAGWLVESALVLSHTYKLITKKWLCQDQNLKLLKTLQCLTKWLFVLSNYHNFNEAKVVLRYVLHTIDIIEQIEKNTFCIANAYVAVSQYYYVLKEFDEAWSWAIKSVLELRTNSKLLKIIVLSHAIRVSCALYKFKIARKLRNQLMAWQDEVSEHTNVTLLLSDAIYLFNIYDSDTGIPKYYTVLDGACQLYGYYNLHTAVCLVNYAFVQYEFNYSQSDSYENLQCILQAIFIMQKIGVPNDNLLLVNAHQIKSLILQAIAFDLGDHHISDTEVLNHISRAKQTLFIEAEAIHLNALKVTIKSLGENTLMTASSYSNLGTLYLYQEKYIKSEEMYLKEIEIKKSILGAAKPEFAQSTSHLAHLYTYHLNKFQEAELLFLQTIKIYKSTCDGPYREIKSDIKGLRKVYKQLGNMEMFNHYTEFLVTVEETIETWYVELRSELNEKNCLSDNFSLAKFKCILIKCSCGEK